MKMGVPDLEILTAFQKDMNEGGKLLFQRYYKPLVLFSGSMLNDCTFPEDIVQEVFYHFIKNNVYRQLSPEALSTYLFRCVKNACLNKIRDQREFAQAELLRYDAVEEEAMTVSLELIEAIRKAIEELPRKTRMVVMSVVVEGKKYKETAEEQGRGRTIGRVREYREDFIEWWFETITPAIFRCPFAIFHFGEK